MKIVYLIRHSTPNRINVPNKEIPLSEEGILKANKIKEIINLNEIDEVYSSSYKRAYETAKILSDNVIIDSRLDEREIGDLTNIPKSMWITQLYDEDAKAPQGESRKEVTNRMLDFINSIEDNKKIIAVSHAATITFFLLHYCKLEDVDLETKSRHITFNGKDVINGIFKTPEIFKLTFDKDKLIDASILS